MKSHSGEQVNLLGSCFPVKGMSYERMLYDFKHRTAYNILSYEERLSYQRHLLHLKIDFAIIKSNFRSFCRRFHSAQHFSAFRAYPWDETIQNTLLLLGLITQSKQRFSFLQNQNLATAMAYYLRSVSKQHNLLLHIN